MERKGNVRADVERKEMQRILMHIFIHFLTLCLQNGITEHIYVIQDALNKMSMSTD